MITGTVRAGAAVGDGRDDESGIGVSGQPIILMGCRVQWIGPIHQRAEWSVEQCSVRAERRDTPRLSYQHEGYTASELSAPRGTQQVNYLREGNTASGMSAREVHSE